MRGIIISIWAKKQINGLSMTTSSTPKTPRTLSGNTERRAAKVEKIKVNPFEDRTAAIVEKSASDKPANVQTKLREARISKKLTIEQCATFLCIRRVQLEAIENGKFKELPSAAHGIGFVRSYADYLGLPSDKIVEQYRRETRAFPEKTELSFPVPMQDSHLPSKKIIFGSILGLIVLILAWNWYSARKIPTALQVQDIAAPAGETTTTADTPVATTADTATESDLPPAPTQSPTPQTKVGASFGETNAARIELYAAQDSWMQIRDAQSAIVFSQVLHAGDTYRVPMQKGLTLTVGNAAGLQVKIDGNALPPLGNNGQIIKNILLDPDALKSKASQAPLQ